MYGPPRPRPPKDEAPPLPTSDQPLAPHGSASRRAPLGGKVCTKCRKLKVRAQFVKADPSGCCCPRRKGLINRLAFPPSHRWRATAASPARGMSQRLIYWLRPTAAPEGFSFMQQPLPPPPPGRARTLLTGAGVWAFPAGPSPVPGNRASMPAEPVPQAQQKMMATLARSQEAAVAAAVRRDKAPGATAAAATTMTTTRRRRCRCWSWPSPAPPRGPARSSCARPSCNSTCRGRWCGTARSSPRT